MLDFEHVKQLYITNLDLEISDRVAQKASDEITRTVPDGLQDKLTDLTPTSPEFETAFRAYFATPTDKPKAAKPKADKPEKRRGVFRQAKRVSRSVETWRVLANYPTYEISSHGRVRAVDRARVEDWLKPRRRWFRGMSVDSVSIRDRDGNLRSPMIGTLLVQAGYVKDWRKA